MLGLTALLQAAPLQKEVVSAQAKWLLHLDLDNLRETQFGKHLYADVLLKEFSKPLSDLNEKLNLSLDFNKLASLTAYGTDYSVKPEASGVLVIKTGMNVEEILNTLLVQQTNLSPQNLGDNHLKRVQTEAFDLYSIENEVFLAPQQSTLIVAKSRSHLEKALQVIKGKAGNMKSSKAFADFPAAPDTFFFLGVAEGFSPGTKPEDAPGDTNEPMNELSKQLSTLAPQAKILQMADGGRVVLGEKADNVFLNVALKAKTVENATQIQQVLQGVSALLALSKANDPNFFLPPLNITAEARTVSINVSYPVNKLLQAVDEYKPKPGQDAKKHNGGKKAKKKKLDQDQQEPVEKPVEKPQE
jgi:hypothetical protein